MRHGIAGIRGKAGRNVVPVHRQRVKTCRRAVRRYQVGAACHVRRARAGVLRSCSSRVVSARPPAGMTGPLLTDVALHKALNSDCEIFRGTSEYY